MSNTQYLTAVSYDRMSLQRIWSMRRVTIALQEYLQQ